MSVCSYTGNGRNVFQQRQATILLISCRGHLALSFSVPVPPIPFHFGPFWVCPPFSNISRVRGTQEGEVTALSRIYIGGFCRWRSSSIFAFSLQIDHKIWFCKWSLNYHNLNFLQRRLLSPSDGAQNEVGDFCAWLRHGRRDYGAVSRQSVTRQVHETERTRRKLKVGE